MRIIQNQRHNLLFHLSNLKNQPKQINFSYQFLSSFYSNNFNPDIIIYSFAHSMQISYPLKRSAPVQFADTLVLNLEQTYNAQTAHTFRPLLTKINQLRNKLVTQLNSFQPQSSDEEIDKTIDIISAYAKFASILLKRFNWNSQSNKGIGGISFVWTDSFLKVDAGRNTIAFDVYCCYYNLAVLYFMRAMKLSQVDLDSSRKEAIARAKAAAFVLKEMREKYPNQFSNCGFHDTQPAHLAALENLCMGLIYKCTFDTFNPNEYKIGINRIASIASFANRYFYKAFTIASSYFTNQASGIFDKTKTELLSFAFLESLYFDVISNVKLAKYNLQLVEKQQIDRFPLVIGYQKKAYRIADIALGNSNIEQLFNINPNRKKELLIIKQDLFVSVGKDLQRNNQIYQQKEIPEEQLPPAEELPAEMNITLTCPPNLVMENEGEFSRLMSPESSQLALELSNFAKSRKAMLDSSFKKLNDEVTKVFIETGINFYLDDDSTIQTIPQSVKTKISEINQLGGKYKLEEDMEKIRQSPGLALQGIRDMRARLDKEEAWDQEKRMLYKEKWARHSSDTLNSQYYQKLEACEGKLKAAAPVDQKVLDKYKKNLTYISILDQPDEQICLVLPRVEKVSNAQNAQHVDKMRQIVDRMKHNAEQIDTLTQSIGDFLEKTNYALIASDTVGKQKSKQQVFKDTFLPLQQKITQFNMQCKVIKEQVQQAASIAVYLNSNSKNIQSSKVQHEGVLVSLSEVYSLFNNFSQSLTFYDKLKDHLLRVAGEVDEFVVNREVTGKELEDKIRGKGEPGGGTSKIISFPSIYPNEQQIDFNLFRYNPDVELETPQEINYTEKTQGAAEGDQPLGGQNFCLKEGPKGSNWSNGNEDQGEKQVDITELFNNFCNVQTPEYLNDLGVKKQ